MALSTKILVCAALGASLILGCAEEAPSPVGVAPQADDLVTQGSVSGLVYYDANTNGRFDEGEAGLSHIEVVYVTSGGSVLTTASLQ